MSADLVAFLRARLAEDEQVALTTAAKYGAAWTVDDQFESVRSDTGADVIKEPHTPRQHIALHDPARVLAEVEAKRRAIDEFVQAFAQRDELADTPHSIQGAVRLLTSLRFVQLFALPYAAHSEYRPEWAPGA